MMSYADCMNEITADELYDRLIKYGLFSEKLPPVFDGELFFSIVRMLVDYNLIIDGIRMFAIITCVILIYQGL